MTAFATQPAAAHLNSAHLTTPTQSAWPATNEVPIVESFLGEIAVRTLDDAEFDLLVRCVDAVIRSEGFSGQLLQFALRLDDQQTELMTNTIEALGLVAAGASTERRAVNAGLEHLPLIMQRLNGARVAR